MNSHIADHLNDRLVVIGTGGRLGSAMFASYSVSHCVTGFTRSQLDLSDSESICMALEPLDFDRLVLSGALTAVDYCETHAEEAFVINSDGPKLVAEICAAKGAHLTYISTDFVFDGLSNHAYSEEMVARPLSVYGASKLEGEGAVLRVSNNNLVARVSWLYGSGKPAFPEWIIQQAMKHSKLALPGEKIGIPTYTEDVVEYVYALLGLDGRLPAHGIYHLGNSGQCNWQQWGQFCIDQAAAVGLSLQTNTIEANCLEDIAAFVAPRPINSVLSTKKFTCHTGITPRPWQDAMREHFACL